VLSIEYCGSAEKDYEKSQIELRTDTQLQHYTCMITMNIFKIFIRTHTSITPDLLKPHPNTYTYSKRLAELLVRDHYETMPVIIARPSIGKFICHPLGHISPLMLISHHCGAFSW